MNIILLGPPGVGKGTTAKLLSEKFKFPIIGTGDLLREEISKSSEIGKNAETYVKSGRLVPDELVTEMVKARLTKKDVEKGCILDGFPRTADQAKSLKEVADIDKVLNFRAPKKTLIERIKKRSGNSNDKIEARIDDNPEVITKRLKVYKEETLLLIDFYRNEGILSDIDSTQNVQNVFDQCVQALNED